MLKTLINELAGFLVDPTKGSDPSASFRWLGLTKTIRSNKILTEIDAPEPDENAKKIALHI